MVNGERRVTPCDCRQRARLETEKLQPGGFQQIGRLSDRVIERLKIGSRHWATSRRLHELTVEPH